MKKAIIFIILIALAGCTNGNGEPASQEYWNQKMCTQPKYKHLDRCKEVEQDNSAAIVGVIGQM